MRGALVRETRISKPQENMEVNTLSEGFYLFEIQSNSGKIRKSIIIR